MATKKKRIYRVQFLNQGKVYEVYARSVSQSNLLGFVEIEDLLFGERSGVVVDPSEERLKSEFTGVERSYIPMHHVLRIDEVEKRGTSQIRPVAEDEGKVTQLPTTIYQPGKKKD